MQERVGGIILTAQDFQIRDNKVFINQNKINKVPGMLLIHGFFCGHCKRFMSTFNDIADNIGSGFFCASIESNELKNQNSLVEALKFEGYPTICMVNQDGLITEQYEGNRDKKSILDKICKSYHKCYQ